MTEETFRIVITSALGVAVVALVVAILMTLQIVARIRSRVDNLAETAGPLLITIRKLTEENGPRFSDIVRNAQEISSDAADISGVAKDQAHRFADVGRDIADRTRAQVARLDTAVDETIERAHETSENVKAAVLKPVREASGIAAGVKAAVSTFAHGTRASVNYVTQDEEMFI
jgi:methyl-accepting chemotaxis protein